MRNIPTEEMPIDEFTPEWIGEENTLYRAIATLESCARVQYRPENEISALVRRLLDHSRTSANR